MTASELRLLHWPEEDRARFHHFVNVLGDLQARVQAISGELGGVPVPRVPRAPTPQECARMILAHRRDLRTLAGADGDMFSDPAWELLLTVFQSEVRLDDMALLTTAGFSLEARAPRRWIAILEQRGWLTREDGKLVLGEPGAVLLARYFDGL
ncbi:hypothetical protein RN629_04185 [Sphingomonadaceae bacterium jetA1]|jgi:hypothetical protein|uniref:hypothetical protein n=1 Tax=Facivitalis istanbulensis TaxID=3075838 RepID=UPI00346EEAC2